MVEITALVLFAIFFCTGPNPTEEELEAFRAHWARSFEKLKEEGEKYKQ